MRSRLSAPEIVVVAVARALFAASDAPRMGTADCGSPLVRPLMAVSRLWSEVRTGPSASVMVVSARGARGAVEARVARRIGRACILDGFLAVTVKW